MDFWLADRHEARRPYRDTREFRLVWCGRPLRLGSVRVDIGEHLVAGRVRRPPLTLPPGYRRYDWQIADASVPREAVEVFHDGNRWVVDVRHAPGAVLQVWGSDRADLIQGRHDLGLMPTSLRIDGRHAFVWLLLHPDPPEGASVLTASELEQDADPDRTDPDLAAMAAPFPEGSKAARALERALPAVCSYYGQFLEWPPRLDPAVDPTVPETYSSEGTFKRAIRDLRAEASVHGYPATNENGRETALITWLTASGNLPFDTYAVDSRLGEDEAVLD